MSGSNATPASPPRWHIFLFAVLVGAWSCHAMLQWAWRWDGSLTGWNLVLTAMGAGYTCGFFLPSKARNIALLALAPGCTPLWAYGSHWGLFSLFALMLGWAGWLGRYSHQQYLLSSYGTAAGFALAYLLLLPLDVAPLLPAGICVLLLLPHARLRGRWVPLSCIILLNLLAYPAPQAHFWLAREWTPYGWLTVWDQEGDRYMGYMRGHKMAVQSRMHKDQPTQPADYVKATAALFEATGAPRSILDLGTGGGSFARWASDRYPKAFIQSVDASPQAWEILPRYYPMPERVRWTLADARAYLQQRDPLMQPFEWIYIDLYSFDEPPSHTLTLEFWQLVKAHSAPNTVILANVLADKAWYAPLAHTFQQVFPDARYYSLSPRQGILGAGDHLPPSPSPYPQGGVLITDDKNPTLR